MAVVRSTDTGKARFLLFFLCGSAFGGWSITAVAYSIPCGWIKIRIILGYATEHILLITYTEKYFLYLLPVFLLDLWVRLGKRSPPFIHSSAELTPSF
jgi:hypothetical protein